MHRKQRIIFYCLVIFVGACAAPLPPVADPAKPPQAATAVIVPVGEVKTSSLGSFFRPEKNKDEEIFLQGMQQITASLNQDGLSTAKQTLEALISGYPQSKWSDAARTALRLTEELDTSRHRLPIEQDQVKRLTADKSRILQENEQLKKELRLLSEKYQADLTELQLANDQLKKDLQLLKNLEIQLDRREKTLR